MGFRQWYLRRGRIPRRTWWLHYTLPLAALGVLAQLADLSVGYDPAAQQGLYGWTGGPMGTLVLIFSIVPSISSTVARLHDRGRSAAWLCWSFLPLIGALVLLVENGFLRGTDRPNRFGPPVPLERSGSLPYAL